VTQSSTTELFEERRATFSFLGEQFWGGLPGRPDLARGQGARYFGSNWRKRFQRAALGRFVLDFAIARPTSGKASSMRAHRKNVGSGFDVDNRFRLLTMSREKDAKHGISAFCFLVRMSSKAYTRAPARRYSEQRESEVTTMTWRSKLILGVLTALAMMFLTYTLPRGGPVREAAIVQFPVTVGVWAIFVLLFVKLK
jgi:hypothetical protein